MNSAKKSKAELKRGYSRGGCRECKRRKIKCDETKPSCQQCTRLQKECAYPKEGEKVLRVSKKILATNPNPVVPTPPKPFTIQLYLGPNDFAKGRTKKKIKKVKVEPGPLINLQAPSNEDPKPEINRPSSIINLLNSSPHINIRKVSEPAGNDGFFGSPTSTGSISHVSPSSMVLGDVYNDDDLNLIALDLNNIVNDIIFTSNMNFPNHDVNDPNFIFNPFLVQGASEAFTQANKDDIPKHIPLDYIKLNTDKERGYLENFYFIFSMQILPFGAYDKTTGLYSNPLRDIILKYASKEPFLLSAVLSQGAKIAHEKTNDVQDYDAYGSYLSTCLRLLGPALTRNREKKVKDDLTSNIESILITVLLLTSSNACTAKQSWRPHLKGAKDILIKATNSRIRLSKTLILCRIWFADFEILAGQSSHLGGTLKLDSELDSVINFTDEYEISVLKDFNIIQDNNYSIMFGYNTNCVHIFRDLSKILNRRREEGEDFKPLDSLEYIRLLSGFYNEYNITYIDRSCYPVNATPTAINETHNLIDTIYTTKGNITVSWMDLTQQAYSLAGLITVFTQVLLDSPDLPHIKDLNQRLVSLISVFEKSKDHSKMVFPFGFLMIQWPMSVAGMNCTEEDQKSIIEGYFKICASMNSSSAEIAIKRIKKVWELRERGEEYLDDDDDDEVNKIDIVAY